MIKNKVFGWQFIKQSPIEHHNLDNYQWYDINEDIRFNIHNHTVKRLYWFKFLERSLNLYQVINVTIGMKHLQVFLK